MTYIILLILHASLPAVSAGMLMWELFRALGGEDPWEKK